MTVSTPPTLEEMTQECLNMSSDSEDFILNNEDDNNFDKIELTNFYSNEETDQDLDLRKKVEENKWFYLKNQHSFILALNKITVYNRYKNDTDFIGFKYKQIFNSETDTCILLTQIVNEREQMRSLGKILFYRELYLSTRKNESVKRMFNRYIGENENVFSDREKKNIDFYRWKFLVHKRRFNYISHILEHENGHINIVSCVKNYNDVIDVMKKIINDNQP